MKLLVSSAFCSMVLSSLEGMVSGFSTTLTVPFVKTSTQLHMATWSDSKAVRDYQNFLESGQQEIQRKADAPSVIICPRDGVNELTEILYSMGMGDDLVMTPDQMLPPAMGGNPEYPIYITLPPWEIELFIKNLSDNFKERNEDFVFFAGGPAYGNIEDVLKDYGYCRDSMTQVLITGLEVTQMRTVRDISTRLGTDSMGEEKWAGECAACGKWNGAVGERFQRKDIRCSVDFYRDWRRKMWERNILDAAINLVGAVREERTTQSDVANYYEEEVSDMVWEISQSLRGWKAMTLMFGFEERLFGVAENTGSEKPCYLDDSMFPYIWGNRVFTDTPMFLDYLWYAKEQRGLLQTVELPPKKEGNAGSSIMRQGNLRADGKI